MNQEEERSVQAWKDVRGILAKDEDVKKRYRSLSLGLPAMIMNEGLGQALAFLYSKSFKKGEIQECGDSELFRHLSSWLAAKIDKKPTEEKKKNLLEHCINAENGWTSAQIRMATRESLAYMQWNRRYSQGMLPKQEGG